MAKSKLYGFYRPHDRKLGQYTGELLDRKTGELFTPPSRTKQSFVAECDINNVLKVYKNTGVIRHISAKAERGAFADLPDSVDFQEALNTVLVGQEAFAALPSKVRNRFQNNPQAFLEFMADPNNEDEARKLGLLNPKSPPAEPLGGTPPQGSQTRPPASPAPVGAGGAAPNQNSPTG